MLCCRWMAILLMCFLVSCGGGRTEVGYQESGPGSPLSDGDFSGDASIDPDYDYFVPGSSPDDTSNDSSSGESDSVVDDTNNDPGSDNSDLPSESISVIEGLARAELSSALFICGDNVSARHLYPSNSRFDSKDFASLGLFYLPELDEASAQLDGGYQGFLIGGYFPWSPCWQGLMKFAGENELEQTLLYTSAADFSFDLAGGSAFYSSDSFGFAGFPDLPSALFFQSEGDGHESSPVFVGEASCAGDFNNDGFVDVFLGGDAQGWLERNSLNDLGLAVLDYDHLMHSDIPSLLVGQDFGVFQDSTEDWQIEWVTQSKQILCFDYDRDGDVDIAVFFGSGMPFLLENKTVGRGGAGFITIRLVGPAGNLMSKGASLEVFAGGLRHTRFVSARRDLINYPLSQFHFGLGDSNVIDRIVVVWPDGSTSDVSDIKGSGFLDVFHPIYIDHIKGHGEEIRLAKERVLTYLNNNFQMLDIDVLVLLDLLSRMSDLGLSFDIAGQIEIMRDKYIQENDAMRLQFLDVFDKFYTDKPLTDVGLLDDLVFVDKLTVPALYCNNLNGLPDDYWISFSDAVDQGGYMATHALLSYFWIQENKCKSNLSPADVDRLVLSVADVVRFDDIQAWDLDIEAMAFLLSAKRYDLIRSEWISHMLSVQREDGGWSAAAWFPHQPNNHTTLVALWVLHYLENFNRIQTRFLQY